MTLLYFDPGIGALIIQTLIATVAGVILFSKNLLFKFKRFLGLVKKEQNDLYGDISIDEDQNKTPKSDD